MLDLKIIEEPVNNVVWPVANSDTAYDFWMHKFFGKSDWPEEELILHYRIPDNIPYILGEMLFRVILPNIERSIHIKAEIVVSRSGLKNIYFENKEQFLYKYIWKNT